MQNLRKQRDNSLAVQTEVPAAEGAPLFRIGAVAKLAGVPVTTLRVWETRYGAFTPAKSSGRHRLYAEADVARARLLRQLAGSGHSVGAIAALPTADLQALQAAQRPLPRPAQAQPASRGTVPVAVVGAALATRLDSPAWRQRAADAPLEMRHVFADLADALEHGVPLADEPGTGLLLVRVNVVHVGVYEQLAQLLAQLQVAGAILVYSYGAEPVLASLRAGGLLLRREPVSDDELAQLVRSLIVMDPGQAVPAMPAGGMIPPRRFSDEQLAKVAAEPSRVLCECPRHIAELIMQLASFEDYSAQCLNDSEEDARLHGYLRSVSGSARALFEHALLKVAQHGGMALPDPA